MLGARKVLSTGLGIEWLGTAVCLVSIHAVTGSGECDLE